MSSGPSEQVHWMPDASQPVARHSSEARTRLHLSIVFVVLGIAACSRIDSRKQLPPPSPTMDVQAFVKAAARIPERTAEHWKTPAFSKVVGFHFAPEPYLVAEEYSIIEGPVVDEKGLVMFAKAAGALNSDQVGRLLHAVVTPDEADSLGACYAPHHVFVFYNNEDAPVAAIEVCFGCKQVGTSPLYRDKNDNILSYDFLALAQLAWEAGIWDGSKSDFREYRQDITTNRLARAYTK